MTKEEKKAHEEKMWGMIEAINWPKNCTNLKALKRHVLEIWPMKDALALRKFCNAKQTALYNRVDKLELETAKRFVSGGDDTYGDKLWETVSRGKAHYEACFKDPSIIEKTPYKECFSYCLPYNKKCYEVLEHKHYLKSVNKLEKEIFKYCHGRKKAEKYFNPVLDLIRRIRENMLILSTYREIVAVWDNCVKELAKNMTVAEAGDSIQMLSHSQYWLANIATDYANFFKKEVQNSDVD